jgi:hypothetical protein
MLVLCPHCVLYPLSNVLGPRISCQFYTKDAMTAVTFLVRSNIANTFQQHGKQIRYRYVQRKCLAPMREV